MNATVAPTMAAPLSLNDMLSSITNNDLLPSSVIELSQEELMSIYAGGLAEFAATVADFGGAGAVIGAGIGAVGGGVPGATAGATIGLVLGGAFGLGYAIGAAFY